MSKSKEKPAESWYAADSLRIWEVKVIRFNDKSVWLADNPDRRIARFAAAAFRLERAERVALKAEKALERAQEDAARARGRFVALKKEFDSGRVGYTPYMPMPSGRDIIV